MDIKIKLYGGESEDELPPFQIGDRLLLGDPNMERMEEVSDEMRGILADDTLSQTESVLKVSELISRIGVYGVLTGRSDAHVVVSDLRTRDDGPLDPSTQTFPIEHIIAVLQRRRVSDEE